MKGTAIILITLLFTSNLLSQIEDGNFEKWDTAYHWMYSINGISAVVPAVWESNNNPNDQNTTLFSVPATRYEGSPVDSFSLKLESNSLGIDASYSGLLYQDIPLRNLHEITYQAMCDSLAGNSGCYVEIFGFNSEINLLDPNIIYQDSITQQEDSFNAYKININDLSSTNYDSIRLQFRAKGADGFVEEASKGHTIFIIDNVNSKYTTNTKEINNITQISPNPFNEILTVNSTALKINNLTLFDLSGTQIISKSCSNTRCIADFSHLPDNMYLLEIKYSDGSKFIRRIIKSGL